MIEWLKTSIARICHQLEFNLFMTQEMRVRLEKELSSLVQQRKQYENNQEILDKLVE